MDEVKIFDISIPVSSDLPVWPGDPRVVLERYQKISSGSSCNNSKLACSVHTGTHVDAPVHFIENGTTVENLSLKALIGPALVVELPEADMITPEMLDALTLVPQTTRLLLKTRNSALWANPHHPFHQDFVALSPDAASWIIGKGIGLVGIDYLSIQMFKDAEPLTHRILLEAGVIIIEGLDLQEVTPGNYQLICLPIKLAGSDGAPARAVLVQE